MSQKISLRKNNCKKFINQPKNSSLLTSDLNKFTPLSHLKPCSTNINNFKNNQPKKKSNSMASINSTIKKINELSKKKNTNPLLNSTINKSKLTKNTTKSDSINKHYILIQRMMISEKTKYNYSIIHGRTKYVPHFQGRVDASQSKALPLYQIKNFHLTSHAIGQAELISSTAEPVYVGIKKRDVYFKTYAL